VKRPLLAVGLGVVALALSIPLVLLGRAMLAAPERADVARMDLPAGARVETTRSFFDRAADDLLGVGTDDPFFELAAQYRHAVSATGSAVTPGTAVRLAALARRVQTRGEQSQAHVMVGSVFALPAGTGSISFGRLRQFGGGRLLAQAEQEFREAALLDDRNDAAKYDLELILASRSAPFSALSKRRQTPADRPFSVKRHQGRDAKHARTHRRLRQGGVKARGSGY
jgi:hypothetical protein